MDSLKNMILLSLSLAIRIVHCSPQGAALASVSQSGEFLATGAAPDLAQPASASALACGGCYLVADVAGLVWYSQVFINTAATALVSVGVGNGTRATRTSLLQNEGSFTFNPTTVAGNALTQLNFQPSATVSGAVLTSPTAYNVFTAYSVTSAYLSNGICITTSGKPITLSSAYSQELSASNGQVTLDANDQQDFVDFLSFSTCSVASANIGATALLQVTNTTATQTSTFSNVPLAAATASLTIAPQSSPASASAGATTSGPSTTVFPSAGAPVIVIGNQTITPAPHPIALPTFNGTFIGTATNLGGTVISSGFVLPTGGNISYPNGTVAYVGSASLTGADAWLGAWGAAMLGLGALVLYL